MPRGLSPLNHHAGVALVVLGALAALIVAAAGRRPPQHHWASARLEPQDGTNSFTMTGPAWAGVGSSSAHHSYHSMHVCGGRSPGEPLIATSDYTYGRTLRDISTHVFNPATGETLIAWPDRWLVCPVQPDERRSDLLLWFPEAWYERASEKGAADPVRLFQHNYAMDFKLLNTDTFTTALEAAARGESLAVYSRLAIVGMDAEEQSRFRFDPRYTADDGFLYETEGGRVAVVETDGGYANTDLFYLLFGQPQITDGEALTLRSSEDIDGSYRGFFTVDIEQGTPLWYRRMGVTSVRNRPVDLDGDGIDEILVETYCAENGVSGGGTTDAGSVYVLCLDQGGNILWRKRLLGFHLGAQVAAADTDGDGMPEVVVTWSSGYYEQVGGIAILSADGRTLRERTDLGGLYGTVVADFDSDGAVEIATGGPGGRIYALDTNLAVESTRVDTTDLLLLAEDHDGAHAERGFHDTGTVWRSRVMPVAATDLTGDGVPEIVALHTAWQRWDMGLPTIWCGRGDLVVMDGGLDELIRAARDHRMGGRYAFPADMPASRKMVAFPLDVDADGRSELILGTMGRGMFVYWGTDAS